MEELSNLASSYPPTVSSLACSPLHFAAANGSTESLQKLQSPALFEYKDPKGFTPLHYALAAGQKENILFLIEKTDLSYRTLDGNSYLHFAALSGDLELVVLLAKRIDPTLSNRDGLTAAHLWAIVSDDTKGLSDLPVSAAQKNPSWHPLQLMLVKQAKAAELSDSECNLLFYNLVSLALICPSFLLSSYKIDHWSASFLGWGYTGVYLLKSLSIAEIAASTPFLADTSKPENALQFRFFGWLFNMPLATLQTSLSAAAVAQNTLKSLPKLKHCTWQTGLFTTGIRCLNSTCALLDASLSFDGYPRYYSPLRWLGDPKLEQCFNDRNANDCLSTYKFYFQSAFGRLKCSPEFKKWYRETASEIHPDKNDNPAMKQIQTNLNRLNQYICRKS